jgi:hypothetical protein
LTASQGGRHVFRTVLYLRIYLLVCSICFILEFFIAPFYSSGLLLPSIGYWSRAGLGGVLIPLGLVLHLFWLSGGPSGRSLVLRLIARSLSRCACWLSRFWILLRSWASISTSHSLPPCAATRGGIADKDSGFNLGIEVGERVLASYVKRGI